MIKYTEKLSSPQYMVNDKIADIDILFLNLDNRNYFNSNVEEVYQKIEKILNQHLKYEENYNLLDLGKLSYTFIFIDNTKEIKLFTTYIIIRHETN